MKLPGRVVVVTGGASGLGEHIAAAFRSARAEVVVVDLREPADVLADVTTPAGRAAITAAVPALDVLVNNAGAWSRGAQYPEAPVEAWRAALELDLLTPMELAQRLLPALSAGGGGAIVNVSSSAALGASAYGSPEYAAAKAGLIRFTTSLADWRERYGVRVNCVVPGWVGLERAHEQRAGMSAAQREAAGDLVPPGTVAAEVVRLAADDACSGHVTELLEGAAAADPGEPWI